MVTKKEKQFLDFNGLVHDLYLFFVFLFVFSLPFESIPLTSTMSISHLFALFALICFALDLVTNKPPFYFQDIFIPVFAYAIYSAVSILYAFDSELSKKDSLALFENLVLIFIFVSFGFKNLKETIVGGSVASSFVASIVLFFSPKISGGGNGRRTITLFNSYIDPNYLALLLLLGCLGSVFFICYFYKKNRPLFLMMALTAAVSSCGIVLTGSRVLIVFLALSLLTVLIFEIIRNKANKKAVFSLISIFVIFVLLCVSLLFVTGLYSRFSFQGMIFDFLNGRFKDWTSLSSLASSRVFFGWGFGSYSSLSFKISGYYEAAHNVFVQTFFELGVFGLVFLLLFFVALFWQAIKSKDLFTWLFSTLCLLFSLFFDPWTAKCFWLIVCFALIFSGVNGLNSKFTWELRNNE